VHWNNWAVLVRVLLRTVSCALEVPLGTTDLLLTAFLQTANKYRLPSALKSYSSLLTISTANDQSLCLTHLTLFSNFRFFPYQLYTLFNKNEEA
jgi:hypothetical protein